MIKRPFFKRKQTEVEWQADVEHFFNHQFTDPWFKFAEWILITGAFGYLHTQTNSIWVAIIYAISFTSLASYCQYKIYSSKFFYNNLPDKMSPRLRETLSYVPAAVLAVFFLWLIQDVISQLSDRPV
jgi:hypothetical protein